MGAITSDEVNYVVWRYLQEAGYVHSAFTFGQESAVATNVDMNGKATAVPSGHLISLLQRGLQFAAIETHVMDDGTERECENPFLLVGTHSCSGRFVVAASATSLTTATKQRKEVKKKQRKEKVQEAAPAEEDAAMEDVIEELPAKPGVASGTTEDGELVLVGHEAEVISCAWNPKRTGLLASGSGDATVRLWPVQEGASRKAIIKSSTVLRHRSGDDDAGAAMEESRDVTALDWDSSGEFLATACYDGQARIWGADGRLVRTLYQHRGPIFALRWNPAGTHLLSGGFDQITIVWSPSTGEMQQSWAQHSAPILDIDWADDRRFATCSTDQTIWVNELGRPSGVKQFCGHSNEVNSVAWDPTGTILASCSDDTTAKIWDMSHDSFVHDLTAHGKEIYALEWSPTGPPTLATASFDATVKLWDPLTGQCKSTLSGHQAAVYAIAFSPDGKYIASGSLDDTLRIWSAADSSLVKTFHGGRSSGGPSGGGIFEVDWNADGSRIAACTSEGTVCVLDFRK